MRRGIRFGSPIRVCPKNGNVKGSYLEEVFKICVFSVSLFFGRFSDAGCILAVSPLKKTILPDTNDMTVPAGFKGLRFPCECVSSRPGGYSEPWAAIAKNKLLPDGTKEEILNVLARGPNTITQIADILGLSAPSVHTHVSDMIRSELLREAVQWQKVHPAERYYEPNFPVFKATESAEFLDLCEEMAEQLATLFERRRAKMERAFQKTSLPEQGWALSDVTQCLYANTYRSARTLLEQRGLLTPRAKHANGAEWIFWAEESKDED